jgi:acyl-CoA thioesterase I
VTLRRPSFLAVAQRLLPGVRATLGRTAEFAAWWAEANEAALASSGPLWVALGDSTAQGIGAAGPELGYVGRLLDRLRAAGEPWRVVNLSKTGARVSDVVARQLPAAAELSPALVTCAVGSNDLLWRTPRDRFETSLDELLSRLPPAAVIATLPQGIGRRRPLEVNARIVAAAATRQLRIADVWSRTGPPYGGKFAGDGFHPNARGYGDWADAFADVLLAPSAGA